MFRSSNLWTRKYARQRFLFPLFIYFYVYILHMYSMYMLYIRIYKCMLIKPQMLKKGEIFHIHYMLVILKSF